jgi:prepilin-type N-terminal cleavage/methylation domain-containing protein
MATPFTPRSRRGFTLTELLVVLGIIILMSLAAVPAVRFIMGSRSVESAQNIVAAMISRARNQAVNDGETRGVFFFLDPATDRTTMAIVAQQGQSELAQYEGWTSQTATGAGKIRYIDPEGGLASATVPPLRYYAAGQTPNSTSAVIFLSALYPNAETYRNYLGKTNVRPIVTYYTCVSPAGNHVPSNATAPNSIHWGAAANSVDVLADTEFQTIPAGVGLQLINSNPTAQSTGGGFDRYLRLGCILFDKDGRFISLPFSIGGNTTIGRALHLNTNSTLTTTNGGIPSLYSQFGIVLYDRQTFLAQNGATEGDFIFKTGGFWQPAVTPKFPASWAAENTEETWLDSNSVPLLIDRYNGSIIKGE